MDRNLRLQYLAGESVRTQIADKIYFEIIRDAEFSNRFNLNDELVGNIRESFEGRRILAEEKLRRSAKN